MRLRARHDLSFLARWGKVFRVFDDQDSGNLCFGVDDGRSRVFVKYAGAPTVRYDNAIGAAVVRNRAAGDVYRALENPSLVRLRESVDLPDGHALVFDWTDAVPLGRQYGQRHRVGLAPRERAEAVLQIYRFAAQVAARGWVAVDLYDGSIMLDAASGRVVICDIDFFERAPVVNRMGRMWGSARFMSPEEHTLGARIDEVTNVYALGALAHTLLGDDETRSRASWAGTTEQFEIAARASRPGRGDRWPSVAALTDAWGRTLRGG